MSANREIGGYMELERFGGTEYHADAFALNCGRSCLEFVIVLRHVHTIWLPDFLCDSVPELCERCKVNVKRYAVGFDLKPCWPLGIGQDEYLYLVDYYGQLTSDDVGAAMAQARGNLIVDESQDFFRRPWSGADVLYTCRKYFGVPDGGYLYTREQSTSGNIDLAQSLYNALPISQSCEAMTYVLGRFERPASEFYQEARQNNARFAHEPLAAMSAITHNILRAINYEEVRGRRLANWLSLEDRLGATNQLHLAHRPDGPFMYPYLLDASRDAAEIRRSLAARKIYVPQLWPSTFGACSPSSAARVYANSILPLPIDQRYGADDMAHVVEELKSSGALS